MLRIGARAHDFGKLPADELAGRIAAKGLCCVQLAVSKAIAGIDLKPGEMNAGLAFEVGRAFREKGVQIAVLGCYINLCHPAPAIRNVLRGVFHEHLRHARDFGCGLVATETGSLNADWSYHPENRSEGAFSLMVRSVAELVEEAEKWGVVVGIEGVVSHVLNSPARIRRLIEDIQSDHLADCV